MKKPLIPFGWMPGSWGLKGTTREIAKAEYELSGVELELRLAEIRIGDETDLEREKLAIMRRHDLISVDDYSRKIIDLAPIDENQKKLEHLEQDLKSGKIDQIIYDRKKADILEEPWVSMPKIHWNPLGKSRAYFEMDYNSYFIKQLRDNGYEGEESEIINQWMNDVCIGMLEEINDMDVEFATPTRRGGAAEE